LSSVLSVSKKQGERNKNGANVRRGNLQSFGT